MEREEPREEEMAAEERGMADWAEGKAEEQEAEAAAAKVLHGWW